MSFKNLIIAVQFFVPFAASANWITSTFTVRSTYVDLVALTRTPAFELQGTAVIESRHLTAGHLVVGGRPYACSSVGHGVLGRNGRPQFICNLDPSVFLQLLNEQAQRSSSYELAMNDIRALLRPGRPLYSYVTIVVANETTETIEAESDYSLRFWNPGNHLSETVLRYSSSGATPF